MNECKHAHESEQDVHTDMQTDRQTERQKETGRVQNGPPPPPPLRPKENW
jgi:hypothetical protein